MNSIENSIQHEIENGNVKRYEYATIHEIDVKRAKDFVNEFESLVKNEQMITLPIGNGF